MAYLTKNDIVMIKTGNGTIQARVTDMQFRRFRKNWKDKKTGVQSGAKAVSNSDNVPPGDMGDLTSQMN